MDANEEFGRTNYETLKSEYVEYGRNKFLEISRKRVKPDGNEFISISKGYYTPDGSRRYQRGIGFPVDKEMVNKFIEKVQTIVSD